MLHEEIDFDLGSRVWNREFVGSILQLLGNKEKPSKCWAAWDIAASRCINCLAGSIHRIQLRSLSSHWPARCRKYTKTRNTIEFRNIYSTWVSYNSLEWDHRDVLRDRSEIHSASLNINMCQVLHQQLKLQFETLQVMKHIQLSHECNSPPSSRSCFALDKIKYHSIFLSSWDTSTSNPKLQI